MSRVLGSGTVKDCWEVWEENWLQKVVRLAMKTPACCYIQTTMEEALEETPEKRKGWCHVKKNPFQAHFCEKHLCSDTTEQSERLKLMLFVAVKQVMHIHVYTQINHIN